LKNGGKITHFFTICQTFLHFFAYSEELASISIILSLFLCTFAPEASRAVPERVTRQPSFGNHGGQYDAEATFINFKTFQIMQQHIYYIRYALRFADMQISELVSVFNDQVQNRGWSSMQAYHDQALIDEFQRRGIDTTAVTGRKTISFVHPVRYDQFTNRLIPIS
jgi:hypothetical protein